MPDVPSKPDNTPLSEADDRFLDAVLGQAFHPDTARRQQRVAQVIYSLDASPAAQPTVMRDRGERVPYWRRTWVRLAIAAMLLLTAGILWPEFDSSSTAQAMVLRSLEFAKSLGTRHYVMTTRVRRPLGGEMAIQRDLYVDGPRRFAIRKTARLAGADLWLGCNGENYWVVPPLGAPVEGDRQLLGGWLANRTQSDDEILHVTTALEWLARDYDLTSFDQEALADPASGGAQVLCDHIQGLLRDPTSNAPPQIDMWADPETGMARLIVLDWGLPANEIGRVQTSIELVGQPELPDDWFEAAGHYSATNP